MNKETQHQGSCFCGDVKFTVYPEAEHDSWTEAYNDPSLYEWFLQHVKA